MHITRVSKAECSLNELVFGERKKIIDEIINSFKDAGARGGYRLPPPIKNWAGGTLSALHISDTELLQRYHRMTFEGRTLLVRSLCEKMHRLDVREMEVEIPWGTSVNRILRAWFLKAPQENDGEVLYLNITKAVQ